MNNARIKYFATLFICIGLSVSVKAQLHIIPQPLHLTVQKGSFILSSKVVIGVDKESESVGKYLQNYLATNYKLNLKLKVYPKVPATTAIQLVTTVSNKAGAYSLAVKPGIAKIAGNGAGVFYGVQSLIQLLPGNVGGPLKLAACSIDDEPRFQWRGLSLDVSRHFFTVDEVKKYIDVMAHYKLNVFHWHLTDDEGWRIQINKYPKLTEVGAKITYYEKQGKFRKLDNLIDGGGRDGFYTQAEIKEVVKYAQDRYVTILPEIEMPGHSEAAIFAYPELGCQDSTGAKHRVRMLDPSEHTFTFMEDVLTEVMALFPNQYIHIGGDEAEMEAWLKSPTAVALMKKEGLKNEKEVQSYFIKRIEKFLLSKNKKLVGWDEILQGGLAESATVMSWQGEAGGIAAAQMHHHVVMTPLPYMYFDAPQANEDLEPIGWNPPVTWQMVYNYEPMSKELSSEEAEYILGAQGNIWAEKIPNATHLQYMVYPRALAVAELTWSAKEDKDISRFEYKMKQQYGYFKLWNWNARLPDIVGMDNIVTNSNQFGMILKYPLPGAQIRYSVNSKMPDSAAKPQAFPLNISAALKDSLVIKTYTTWTLNKQHIFQVATVKHVNIEPHILDEVALTSGFSYKLIKSKETNYNKLDTVNQVATAIVNSTNPMVLPVTDGNLTWVKMSGYIKIEEEGDYELTSGFEVSPALFLNNQAIIYKNRNTYVEPQKALLHLKKGVYPISGYYVADNNNRTQDLILLKTANGKLLDPQRYMFHL
ncbi:beta-N-acetylhexosaminidase [Mucilaginibacter sp. FT3.2]|uniref:beta-N-acetylhexosaminidase n=1 Tax=Mucilaginibacter sp. FT3.2 TaxID=2723090 RepID=UPI001617DEC3|nr:beta-N-acetylhexosaminidase [Mucilaginibacter sp. FT3.2]MBB6233950.1 hexosaminidase [Mucilaginibacter sp. FT3.2]